GPGGERGLTIRKREHIPAKTGEGRSLSARPLPRSKRGDGWKLAETDGKPGTLVDLDLAGGRNHLALLGQGEGEDPVGIGGLDSLLVDAGDVKAAAEAAIPALPVDEVLF